MHKEMRLKEAGTLSPPTWSAWKVCVEFGCTSTRVPVAVGLLGMLAEFDSVQRPVDHSVPLPRPPPPPPGQQNVQDSASFLCI